MTRDQAIARIQRGLGFRTDLFDEIVSALQEAQRVLESGNSPPRFLLQQSQPLLVPAGNAVVPLPTRWNREFQEEPPWYPSPADPSHIIFPEKLDYDVGVARFAKTDPGAPLAYTLRFWYLVFWPVRDVNYTLTWSYFAQSKDLSTNITDCEWLDELRGSPETLIGRAGMIIAADLEDTTSFQKFAAMYRDATTIPLDQMRDEEHRPLAMGARL